MNLIDILTDCSKTQDVQKEKLFARGGKILFLLGNGGTGKTYALMKTWYELYKHREKYENRCAIYIQLRDLKNSDDPVQAYIRDYIFGDDETKYRSFMRYWFIGTNVEKPLLLFLDGLNEIKVEKQNKVYLEIFEMTRRLNVVIVVTSRYADNLRLQIDNAWRADMQNLDKQQIRSYLKKSNESGKSNAQIESIFNNNRFSDLLSNPLMLSLYAQTSLFYDSVIEKNGIVKKPEGAIFYGPIYFESKIIWNYYQCELMKCLRDDRLSPKEKLSCFVAVSLVLPFVSYKMQQETEFHEAEFELSLSCLKKYIYDAVDHYQSFIDNGNSEQLIAVKSYLSIVDSVGLNSADILDVTIHRMSLFNQITISTHNNVNGNILYGLFHQQLRDCLAAIYLINEIEINRLDKNSDDGIIPEVWKNDRIDKNRYMTLHVAFLENRNGRKNINYLWKKLKHRATVKATLSGLGIHYDILLENLISVYKYAFDDNFSSLDFSGMDLRNVKLGAFNFQPNGDNKIENPNSFKGALFGAKTFPLGGHSGTIYSLSACGNSLLSYGGNSLRLWNISNRRCEDIPFVENELPDKVLNMAASFLPGSECVIAYSKLNEVIECNIQEADTGEKRHFVGGNNQIVDMCYSPNGKYLLACDDKGGLIIWDRTVKGNTFSNIDSFFSVTNEYYIRMNISNTQAFVLNNNEFKVIDFTKRNNYGTLETKMSCKLKANEKITCVCFSTDGTLIAVASHVEKCNAKEPTKIKITDVKIRVWTINDQEHVITLPKHHESIITDLKFHPNDALLASCSLDCSCAIWNISNNELLHSVSSFGSVHSVSFVSSEVKSSSSESNDWRRRTFFIGDVNGKITGYEMCGKICYVISHYDGHRPCVNDISVGWDKKRCIGAYDDGIIREWDITTGALVNNYVGHQSCVYCVEYSEDGEFFASGSENGTIKLWDTYSKTESYSFEQAHGDCVRDLKFTGDDKLISCSNDSTIRIWNIETKECVKVLSNAHSDFVKCLLYYENKEKRYKRLVSGSTDKTVILWDITDIDNIKIVETIHEHDERVRSLALCKERGTFVSNSEDGYVKEWYIENGKETGRKFYIQSGNYQRGADGISYSGDGNCVLLNTETGGFSIDSLEATIEEWELNSQKCLRKMSVHNGTITGVHYLDNGTKLMSSSYDGNIVVAELETGNVLVKMLPVTGLDERLAGYDLSDVDFQPDWIRYYYLGSSFETKKKVVKGKSEDFASALNRGVVLNIFDFIKDESDILEMVSIFIEYTHGFGEIGDKIFITKEMLFLLANAYYLWFEAPPEEQNMFMLAELFAAALDSENREDALDYESDLDRLFKMLEEKDPKHTALEMYKLYKKSYGKKRVIKSCLNRLYPIFANDRNNVSFFVRKSDDIANMAESFIANTNRQKGVNKNAFEAERLLITGLFHCLKDESQIEKRNMNGLDEKLSDIENIIKELHIKNASSDALKAFNSYENESEMDRKQAILSLKARLGFWREFK